MLLGGCQSTASAYTVSTCPHHLLGVLRWGWLMNVDATAPINKQTVIALFGTCFGAAVLLQPPYLRWWCMGGVVGSLVWDRMAAQPLGLPAWLHRTIVGLSVFMIL